MKMAKRAMFVFLVILILSGGILFYLKEKILPLKISQGLNNYFRKEFGLNLDIQDIRIGFFSGIVFKGLNLYRNPQHPILQCQNISLNRISLLFFKKMVWVSSLKIEKPFLFIKRDLQGKLNIQKFLQKHKPSKNEGYRFLIKNIIIKGAKILIEDQPFHFKQLFKNIEAIISFSLPQNINLELNIKDEKLPLTLEGRYLFDKKEFRGKLQTFDLDLTSFENYFKNIPHFGELILKGGEINFSLKKNYLTLDTPRLLLKGKLTREDLKIKGGLLSKGKVGWNLETQEINYHLDCALKNIDLQGLEILPKINFKEGKISLSPEGIIIENVKGTTQGIPFNIRGGIKDFKNFVSDIRIDSQSSLEKLKELLKRKEEISLKGKIFLTLQVLGPLREESRLEIKGTSLIKEGLLSFKGLEQPIIWEGSFSFSKEKDYLDWQDLKIKVFDRTFNLKGKLKNFKKPHIQSSIKSKNVNIETIFSVDKKTLQEISLKGEAYSSPIEARGTLIFEEKSPYLKLQGKLNLRLESLKNIINNKYLQRINPQGVMDTIFFLEGNILNLQELKIYMQSQGKEIKLYNLTLNQPFLKLLMENRELTLSPLQTEFYKGLADLRIKVNLRNKSLVLNLSLQDVDLENLAKDLNSKKPLKGTLAAELQLYSQDLKDVGKLRGQGKLKIKDGLLWELNLFQKLGKILFLPDFQKIVFSDGWAEFLVENKNIVVDELELNSKTLTLKGQGKIDFDRNINFIFFTELNPKILKNSKDLRKITSLILGEGGITIIVNGDISNPQVKIKPFVVSPVKKFKDLLETFLGN